MYTLQFYIAALCIIQTTGQRCVLQPRSTYNTSTESCQGRGGLLVTDEESHSQCSNIILNNVNKVWTNIQLKPLGGMFWENGQIFNKSLQRLNGATCGTVSNDHKDIEILSCWFTNGIKALCKSKEKERCHSPPCLTWSDGWKNWFDARNFCLNSNRQLLTFDDVQGIKDTWIGDPQDRYFWIGVRNTEWQNTNGLEPTASWNGTFPKDHFCAVKTTNMETYTAVSCQNKEFSICYDTTGSLNPDTTAQILMPTTMTELAEATSEVRKEKSQLNIIYIVIPVILVVMALCVGGICFMCFQRKIKRETTRTIERKKTKMNRQSLGNQDVTCMMDMSTRPAACLPHCSHQSVNENYEEMKDHYERITDYQSQTNYSEPLTDEQIFSFVMTAVRQELRKTNKKVSGKTTSVFRKAAKAVIEEYLEPVPNDPGSGQFVLKQGALSKSSLAKSETETDMSDDYDFTGSGTTHTSYGFGKADPLMVREIQAVLQEILAEHLLLPVASSLVRSTRGKGKGHLERRKTVPSSPTTEPEAENSSLTQ